MELKEFIKTYRERFSKKQISLLEFLTKNNFDIELNALCVENGIEQKNFIVTIITNPVTEMDKLEFTFKI